MTNNRCHCGRMAQTSDPPLCDEHLPTLAYDIEPVRVVVWSPRIRNTARMTEEEAAEQRERERRDVLEWVGRNRAWGGYRGLRPQLIGRHWYAVAFRNGSE